MKLVSITEMMAIEREANSIGLSYEMMMENAGRNIADVVLEEFGHFKNKKALGLVGSGNNGGDTLVALAHLASEGWKTCAYLVRPRQIDDPLIALLNIAGGEVFSSLEDESFTVLDDWIGRVEILLDGILGTGFRLPISSNLAEIMETIHKKLVQVKNPPIIVAVDCPSGVDCDSGEAAPECFPATLTITMAAIKQGLLKFPAYNLVGRLRTVGIGLPDNGDSLKAWRDVVNFVPDQNWVIQALPDRPLDAHKGTFGAALIIAGSQNYPGAALLAGKAAYRVGAGLVTLAVPYPLHSILAGHLLEVTWLPLPHEQGAIASQASEIVLDNLARATVILIGPGFGLASTTSDFLSQLICSERDFPPFIIDADGLKLLINTQDWFRKLPVLSILTPHPGEMSVLTGLHIREIQEQRLEVAKRYSKDWGHIVVLKGAFTVVASPDGIAALIPIATPALARAGSGDVLAGVIAGLRAQGSDAFTAAVAGAWIHARAGEYCAHEMGNTQSVLAGDILESVPDVISDL